MKFIPPIVSLYDLAKAITERGHGERQPLCSWLMAEANRDAFPVYDFANGDDCAWDISLIEIEQVYPFLIKAFGFDPLENPVVQAVAPAPAPSEHQTKQATWTLTKPKRFQGYTESLYLLLERAHRKGEAIPTAREVLHTFAQQQPNQIAKVIQGESLDYYLATGEETKTANLKAIAAVIAGMTGKSQD